MSRALLALLLSSALLGACRETTTVRGVRKILVDSALGGDGVSIDRELVRAAVKGGLAPAARLRLDPKGDSLLRARAVGGRVPPSPGGTPVVVVTLKLEAAAGRGRQTALEAHAERRGASERDHPEPLLEAAARAALGKLDRQVILGDQPTPRVVAALEDEDRDLRARAVALLAARRDPDTFEPLVAVLDDEDQAIALRAVGALVALGDARGVKALTDLTHRKPAVFVRQIVYAVGAIGGREAEAYLYTVAAGHSDVTVQKAAEEALEELRDRGAAQAPAPLEEER